MKDEDELRELLGPRKKDRVMCGRYITADTAYLAILAASELPTGEHWKLSFGKTANVAILRVPGRFTVEYDTLKHRWHKRGDPSSKYGSVDVFLDWFYSELGRAS